MAFFKKMCSRSACMFLLIAAPVFCATEPTATPPQQQNKATLVSLTTLFGGLLGAGLPQSSLAQALRMRGYFLSLMTAQTAAGVAAAQPPKGSTSDADKKKRLTAIAYGLYNIPFIELARRIPVATPKGSNAFRAYALASVASQSGGILMQKVLPKVTAALQQYGSNYSNAMETVGITELH